MDESGAIRILNRVGAVITGSHVVYASGKHGTDYVNKDAIYPHTLETSHLCAAIAEIFMGDGVEAVIAPAIGGVILSQWTAHHLSGLTRQTVLGVYAEKDLRGDGFVIRRGYDRLIAGKRVLAVEDVITTGGSVRKVVEAARQIGGVVVGIGALCNRGNVTSADLANVPRLHALVNATLAAWDEADCPLCRQGIPVNTDVGKGREFLSRRNGG